MQDDTKKSIKRSRGRPRRYEPEQAMDRARDAFWVGGFQGTSLDDLSAATGMNRPSLYAAFGDKRALYLTLIGRFAVEMERAVAATLDAETDLSSALRHFYEGALDQYCEGVAGPRGCFVVCTAATEAPVEPEVRAALSAVLKAIDRRLAARFRRARDEGELSSSADPEALAALAAASLHSLAIRARAGQPRTALSRMARQAIAILVPAGPPNQSPTRRRAKRPM